MRWSEFKTLDLEGVSETYSPKTGEKLERAENESDYAFKRRLIPPPYTGRDECPTCGATGEQKCQGLLTGERLPVKHLERERKFGAGSRK